MSSELICYVFELFALAGALPALFVSLNPVALDLLPWEQHCASTYFVIKNDNGETTSRYGARKRAQRELARLQKAALRYI